MRARAWWSAGLFLLPLLLQADQVVLKNGDRVTGTIVNTDDKTLVFKTTAMGEVKIDRSAIASLSSDEPLTVTLTKGERSSGE